MIKITSFHLFQGFLRIKQEFHEEKASVKLKALFFEREYEFNYKDVGEISDTFSINVGQMNFSFWCLFIFTVGVGTSYLQHYLNGNLIFLRIAQVLFFCLILLFLSSFKKSWRILILDKNDNTLAYIDQTRQNIDLITRIVELIQSKSPELVELSVTNPFPADKPVFEHTEYDLSNQSKEIEKFFEDKLIGLHKSIYSEYVYQILYTRLINKVHHGKTNNNITGDVLSICSIFIFIFGGLIFLFNVHFGKQIFYLFYVLAGLFIASLPISAMKRETIGLYNTEGKVHYWTYVYRKTKAHVEKIIEFIRSKIPTDEKS